MIKHKKNKVSEKDNRGEEERREKSCSCVREGQREAVLL